jgi:hypothetical protein
MDGVDEFRREIIDLPANPGRSRRRAVLALRAREIDPPPGITPVQWRLLTAHKVTTIEHALQMTGFYRQRWTIEQLFRLMKTKGFDIEAVRIAEDGPYKNLPTSTRIAAIPVLQVVRERYGAAGRPLQDALDPRRPAGV